jgi:hypothetical protein
VRFAKLLVVLWSLAIIAPLFLPWLRPSSLYALASSFYYYSLVALVYIFAGILIVYLFVGLVSLLIRFREYRDSKDFTQATKLTSKTDDIPVAVYEREETGINKYQNHLASLTYAKPGFIRSVLLRTALLLVGFLARFWFNLGQLGDIPTILAARWVILRGKETERLLFLSNYCGSLDNYLNEFIDLSAVIGLNAIWANTFVNGCSNSLVERANTKPTYAFPQTKYLFQGGAQAEKPFKAYVRQSQIETLVWYSAYPTLTNRNINANGDLRQALFKPSVACELDEAFLKAGL